MTGRNGGPGKRGPLHASASTFGVMATRVIRQAMQELRHEQVTLTGATSPEMAGGRCTSGRRCAAPRSARMGRRREGGGVRPVPWLTEMLPRRGVAPNGSWLLLGAGAGAVPWLAAGASTSIGALFSGIACSSALHTASRTSRLVLSLTDVQWAWLLQQWESGAACAQSIACAHARAHAGHRNTSFSSYPPGCCAPVLGSGRLATLGDCSAPAPAGMVQGECKL